MSEQLLGKPPPARDGRYHMFSIWPGPELSGELCRRSLSVDAREGPGVGPNAPLDVEPLQDWASHPDEADRLALRDRGQVPDHWPLSRVLGCRPYGRVLQQVSPKLVFGRPAADRCVCVLLGREELHAWTLQFGTCNGILLQQVLYAAVPRERKANPRCNFVRYGSCDYFGLLVPLRASGPLQVLSKFNKVERRMAKKSDKIVEWLFQGTGSILLRAVQVPHGRRHGQAVLSPLPCCWDPARLFWNPRL